MPAMETITIINKSGKVVSTVSIPLHLSHVKLTSISRENTSSIFSKTPGMHTKLKRRRKGRR
jgi:hypothetical protein